MSFSDSKLQDYKDAFGAISEGNDTIPVSELPPMLRAFGFTLTEKDFKNIINHYGKPEFTFEEFVQIIKNTAGKREPLTEDEAQDALWVYDHEDSGLITLKEFKSILQTTPGEPLSDAELKEVLEKLGITSASSIKYDDIAKILTQKKPF